MPHHAGFDDHCPSPASIATHGQARLTEDDIAALVAAFGDIRDVLREADPGGKAEIYGQFGL